MASHLQFLFQLDSLPKDDGSSAIKKAELTKEVDTLKKSINWQVSRACKMIRNSQIFFICMPTINLWNAIQSNEVKSVTVIQSF